MATVIRLVLALFLMLQVAAECAARQAQAVTVSAEAAVSRVYVGEPFKLRIRVEGARSAEVPALPTISGMEVRYEGGQDISQSSVVIVNGRRSEQKFDGYIMQFEVVLTRAGMHTIPRLDVRVGGEVHTTNEVSIVAVPPQEDSDVRLKLEVDNATPYLGEPIRLRIVLGLGRSAAAASFTIPGVEAKFDTVDESNLVQQLQNQTIFEILGGQVPAVQGEADFGGQRMTAYTAERVIIPREAGRFTIGPATARVDLIIRQAMSIFDRDQTRRAVVPSNPLTIEVRPIPTEGRPPNFNGLIGQYRVSARAAPTEISVGDPINLTIRVDGPLAASVSAPAIERQPNLIEGFRVTGDPAPGVMEGRTKVFSRVLRAQSTGVSEIPPIELPYFDTQTGRYQIARSEPIPVRVRETRVVTAADAEGKVGAPEAPTGLALEEWRSGIRFNYEGSALLRNQGFDLALAFTSPAGLATVALPPLIYAGAAGAVFLRRRAAMNGPADRRRRAASRARAALDRIDGSAVDVARGVSAALRDYVAAKCDRSGQALTGAECADLIRATSAEKADEFASLIGRCDAALYGGVEPSEARLLRDEAAALIDRLEAVIGGRA